MALPWPSLAGSTLKLNPVPKLQQSEKGNHQLAVVLLFTLYIIFRQQRNDKNVKLSSVLKHFESSMGKNIFF
jgi:hypothetical protein